MPGRSPAEIRSSIESNRAELATSLEKLRGEIVVMTDWRAQIESHRKEVLTGAAIAGFVIGGGLAAIFGGGKRRRRR